MHLLHLLRVCDNENPADFTATVGLGCRSWGYLVYVVIAAFLFLVEMICWRFRISVKSPTDHVLKLLKFFPQKLKRTTTGQFLGTFIEAKRTQIDRKFEGWIDHIDVGLRVLEITNLVW